MEAKEHRNSGEGLQGGENREKRRKEKENEGVEGRDKVRLKEEREGTSLKYKAVRIRSVEKDDKGEK